MMYHDNDRNEFHTQEAANLSSTLTHYSTDRANEIAIAVQGLDKYLHSLETRLAELESERDLAESVALYKPSDLII